MSSNRSFYKSAGVAAGLAEGVRASRIACVAGSAAGVATISYAGAANVLAIAGSTATAKGFSTTA